MKIKVNNTSLFLKNIKDFFKIYYFFLYKLIYFYGSKLIVLKNIYISWCKYGKMLFNYSSIFTCWLLFCNVNERQLKYKIFIILLVE